MVSASCSIRVHRRIVGRQVGEVHDRRPRLAARIPGIGRPPVLGIPDLRAADGARRRSVHQRQRVLQHRHHAEPQEIDLDEPMSAQSSLSHWMTTRSGMLAFSAARSRQAALADHHAAGMPPGDGAAGPGCATTARRSAGSSGSRSRAPASRRLRASVSFGSTHSNWFMIFARRSICAASSDSVLPTSRAAPRPRYVDHVRRHADARALRGGAVAAAFRRRAEHARGARQVDVDVRPLAALLREKALEEQVHADRVHGGDAEVGRRRCSRGRAAPCTRMSCWPAEVHHVPDDEEIAGEVELFDQIELAGDLRAGAVGHGR